jgi:hypothetical protein
MKSGIEEINDIFKYISPQPLNSKNKTKIKTASQKHKQVSFTIHLSLPSFHRHTADNNDWDISFLISNI